MRLAKLTLSGFKSFADKTEFHFDEPMIGVVGPNGCGKSNVVDAIKWVLGERSAKSLRGSAMMDVIFAGSASRKPMGGASVTLTFENPLVDNDDDTAETSSRSRTLNVDTEIVDVTRRLFSDGKSDYLINGSKVRLRDIKELFLDTGVGTNAYSIIEQGKVDAMLLANPIERRAILEEAAGVAKFKARKIEATRKLEHAERNLLLVREKAANTERRLRIVRSQAEKAARFRTIDARRRDLLETLFLERYHDTYDRVHGLTSRVQEASEQRRAVSESITELEQLKQDAELARQRIQQEQHELEQQQLELRAEKDKAVQRVEMTRKSLEDATTQFEQEEHRLTHTESSLTKITTQLESVETEVVALAEHVSENERAVVDSEKSRNTAAELAAHLRSNVDRRRDTVARLEREIVGAEGRLASVDERERGFHDQLARVEARSAPFTNELDQHTAARVKHTVARTAAQDAIAHIDEQRQSQRQLSEALDEQQSTIVETLAQQREDRSGMQSRVRVLVEMEEAREGLGSSMRTVLDRIEQYPGVIGLLADQIETDREHADLIETALGADLQALLIENTNAENPLVQSLRLLDGGIRLLPLETPESESATDVPTTWTPGATPMRALARAHGPAGVVLDRLLQNCWLVDSLETAGRMARTTLPGARFVTHLGERLDKNGRLTLPATASASQSLGWLARKAESRELNEQVADAGIRIQALDADSASLATEVGNAIDALRTLTDQREDARGRFLHATHQLDRIDQFIQRIERDSAHVERERVELLGRFDRLRQEETEQREKLDALRRLLTQENDGATTEESQLAEAATTAESSRDALAAARVQHGESNARLDASRRERSTLRLSRDDAERQLAIHREQLEHRKAQTVRFVNAITTGEADTLKATESLAAMTSEFSSFAVRAEDVSDACNKSAESLHAARSHGAIVERDLHALEMSRRELEIKRENLEERAAEDLDMIVSEVYPAYREARTSDPSREPLDLSAIEEEASQLKDQIRKLGNVNLDAIDELETLEERNEALEHQLIDIDSAREQLEQLIEELNIVSRERFRETFESVRDNFAGPSGMFRRLFGGGNADLFLLPDEEGQTDWLESGIEIRAKPPGKEPRVINQLSGGEKTMTAVALLMAIFQSKPSPFCILDEVDAALDEANVDRFCAVVKQFLDRSHFIIITHHKTTMRVCDRLYGITMPQRGVSRKVAVRFDEVSDSGQLSTAATKRAEYEDNEANSQLPTSPPAPLIEVERISTERPTPTPNAP